jgi:LPS-assembly protein
MLTVGKDVITGDHITLDMRRETGEIHNGSVFLHENHFIIRGDRIQKTGRLSYTAKDASITSCDGERPDWIITARNVDVTVEGYGTATHAVFRAADLPLLYTPYLVFPAKTERQTGLLLPRPAYSSRWGASWDQPFFWAINDHADATFYPHYMQERGLKIGAEYRYSLSDESFGWLMADGLNDQKVDDGTPEATEKWGYGDDNYTRPNTDRYWLRAKLDQELPGGAMARLDLDWVSDQDYLTEFRSGSSGFNATNTYFGETFGRDLDTYDENTRTNRLNVNKTWTHYALNGEVLWNDNVVKRRWEEIDNTLQQLPVIMFDGMKQPLLDSSLYWDIESEAVYFYQEDDRQRVAGQWQRVRGERGYRADLYPRAYLPLRWENYLSLEPSAGWRQTVWRMDRWVDEDLSQSHYRQIYDLELDLSTELSKIMAAPVSGVDRIRHSIKPQVVYTYIPDQDQSDLPDFTRIDRIDAANQVTYSLTNTFTARMDHGQQQPAPRQPAAFPPILTGEPADRESQTPDEAALYSYARFCRFYLEQTYDIAAARDNASETLSDLFGELDFKLSRYFQLDADATYDVYDTRFSSHNVGVILSDLRGDRLRLEHRKKTTIKDSERSTVNESIRSALSINLTDSVQLSGIYERDLLEDQNITRGVGVLYKSQCWALGVYYTKEENDEKYDFLIDLSGIGRFGG